MSPELKAFLERPKITIEVLKELLSYDPVSGHLKWRINYCGTIKKGRIAGSLTKGKKSGYVVIEIGGRAYKAHRLAWGLHHDIWPSDALVIDHKNNIRHDNRIINLRLITSRLNSQNKARKNDLPLYIYKHRKKFAVRITTDKFRTYGSFDSVKEALIKRDSVIKELKIIILEKVA